MIIVKKRLISKLEKAQILALWAHEYPAILIYDSIEDFDLYLQSLAHPCHYLLQQPKGQRLWAGQVHFVEMRKYGLNSL